MSFKTGKIKYHLTRLEIPSYVEIALEYHLVMANLNQKRYFQSTGNSYFALKSTAQKEITSQTD